MNVFVDYTLHSDLNYSLHLLFEERLKMNLFRPIGPEWQTKGFQFFDPADPTGWNLNLSLSKGLIIFPCGWNLSADTTLRRLLRLTSF